MPHRSDYYQKYIVIIERWSRAQDYTVTTRTPAPPRSLSILGAVGAGASTGWARAVTVITATWARRLLDLDRVGASLAVASSSRA